jgi:hypothetical protein
MDSDRAARLRDLFNHPGSRDLFLMLNEQMNEPKNELLNIMAKRPDTLTGKKAVSLAARHSALEDFKESLLEAQQISSQPARAEVRKG